MDYKDETIEIAKKRSSELQRAFIVEVERLIASGGVDTESHSRGLLFGVALENLADGFLRGEKKSKAYKNLRCF